MSVSPALFTLNAFDYVMIVVLVAFTITGALRGFVLEALSIVLWPLTAFIAWLLADQVAPMFESFIGEPQLRLVAAFMLIFLVVFIIGTIVIYLIHRALPLRGVLRRPNVILGAAVGLLRGAIIIVIVFLVAGITSLPQRPWWRESLLAPHFQKAAIAVGAFMPRDIARHIKFS
jgi:membrane protein required for colicin V production